jgi:hypothetical protein
MLLQILNIKLVTNVTKIYLLSPFSLYRISVGTCSVIPTAVFLSHKEKGKISLVLNELSTTP